MVIGHNTPGSLGTFQPKITFPVEPASPGLAVADINGDLDIATATLDRNDYPVSVVLKQ